MSPRYLDANLPPWQHPQARVESGVQGSGLCDALPALRVYEVTTTSVMAMADPVETLTAQAQRANKLTDQHAGSIVRFPT